MKEDIADVILCLKKRTNEFRFFCRTVQSQ